MVICTTRQKKIKLKNDDMIKVAICINRLNSPLCIGLKSEICELCTPRQNMVKMQHGVMKKLYFKAD